MSIYFYSTRDKYGCFSNFSAHGFELDGLYWKTSEHYFQAQKFAGHPEHVEAIRLAKSPKEAAVMGRERTRPLRKDWESVKDDIMRKAVLKKFETHEDIFKVLLSTEDNELVEKTTSAYYWGCGTNGTGKNMLGKILMETRTILKDKKDKQSKT
ncbi:MAG: NADAR family protein [Trueperaceae bacterium]